MFNKTLVGHKNYLFLKSEIDHHYCNNISESDDESKKLKIINYLNKMKEYKKNFKMFIVPDKSVICRNLIPIDTSKLYRVSINQDDFHVIDNLNNNHYYKGDSHTNIIGMKQILKEILNICFPNNDKLNEYFEQKIQLNKYDNKIYRGDLTNKMNIGKDTLYLEKDPEYNEDYYFINSNSENDPEHDYINYNHLLPVKYRHCFLRDTIYLKGEKSFFKKKILIFGDSSIDRIIKMFEFFFQETIFYWNHWIIPDDLIKTYKPDIIMDIRTERFLDNVNIIGDISYETNEMETDKIINELSFIVKGYEYFKSFNNKKEITENINYFKKIINHMNIRIDFENVDYKFDWVKYVNSKNDLKILGFKPNEYVDYRNFLINDNEIIGSKEDTLDYIFFICHYYNNQ